jgi:elongation factor G
VKEVSVEEIRNIALVGHGGTGKTSLCEAMLFTMGGINRMGKVEEGNTAADYSEEEVARTMSVSLALVQSEWKGKRFSILDCPGYADFIGETIGGMRAVETIACLLNAPSGLEVGAENLLHLLDDSDQPRVFFLNKMDKEHANFAKCVTALTDRYGTKAVPVQWPVGEADEFKGIIDLLTMKASGLDTKSSGEIPIPDDVKVAAEEARGQLMEAVAEADDALVEKYLEEGTLTDEEMQRGLRQALAAGTVFPILCGAATTAGGARQFLEFVDHYCPSPADRPAATGVVPGGDTEETREHNSDAPLSALIFKTISEPHIGELSLIKIISGKLTHGLEVLNSTRDSAERIGQVSVLTGKQRAEIGHLGAGEIGAVVKLKATHTGDTLCDKKAPIVLSPIAFPNPIIEMAVKPVSKGDDEKMGSGLVRLHEEDPTFFHKVLPDIHQTILYGQGELHFEVVTSKLKKRFGVEVTLEKPRIPYRETITGQTEVEYKYKKQTGGRGQYGHVCLRIFPRNRGDGFEFVDEIKGGVIPSKFIPSVEKGLNESMGEGSLSGHPVVDVGVALYYGSYHNVDSSDMAFKIAGMMGFREGFLKCKPIMLEPIYEVEIRVPDDFTGDVMGDMSSRRGKIMGMDPVGKWQKIHAQAPQAELYKYSTTLRSLTQGLGTYASKFSHYEEVPRDVAGKVVEEAKAAKAAAEE